MHRRSDHPTQTIKASEARQHWSQLLNEVFKERRRVIVEKSGIPVAALISAEDLARLERYEAQRKERFQALEESWAAFDDVTPEEIAERVAQSLEEIRTEHSSSDDAASSSI